MCGWPAAFERTTEIGVLCALGWRRRRVLALILQESLVLSFLGGLAGTVLGVGLALLARRAGSWIGAWSAHFSPDVFVRALVTVGVLGLVGGAYPAWWATVSAQTSGVVMGARVASGDEVKAGEVLVRLDPTDAQLAVQQAEAALAAAQARLDELKAGPRPEGLEETKAAVAMAQADYRNCSSPTQPWWRQPKLSWPKGSKGRSPAPRNWEPKNLALKPGARKFSKPLL